MHLDSIFEVSNLKKKNTTLRVSFIFLRWDKDKMYNRYEIWKLTPDIQKVKFFSLSDTKSLWKLLPLPSEVLDLLFNVKNGRTKLSQVTWVRGTGKKRWNSWVGFLRFEWIKVLKRNKWRGWETELKEENFLYQLQLGCHGTEMSRLKWRSCHC